MKPARSSTKKTGNSYLLDTNIIIELFNGNVKVAEKLNRIQTFSICVIVLGELYIGINRVANKPKHIKMLRDFLQLCNVLNVDDDTAKQYGLIMADLHKKGKPIPTNDVWIGALAKQHDYVLVTMDKHFSEIGDLRVERW